MSEKHFSVSQRPIFHVRVVPVGVEHGWRVAEEFFHLKCGQPALLHPDSNRVWGCASCQLVTYCPGCYFEQVVVPLVRPR